ncbi:hypothetical protein DW917_12245 [Prevotella sp. AM42-24]|nr:hypothetical protein DW917_12245 [Prevotella sp. AM42-24]
MEYEKKPQISDQTIQKKNIKERALTVWLKRAESPKARNPGQHLGTLAVSNTPCKGKSLKNILFFTVFSHFPCMIQIIIVNLQ